MIERIDGDVTELANFFSQLVIRVLGNLILLIGIVLALLAVDLRLGALFALFAVVTLLILNRVNAGKMKKGLNGSNYFSADADVIGDLHLRQ